MQIYNRKTREIIAIVDEEGIVLNKQYDVSFNNYVVGDGQKIYADTKKQKIVNIKDYLGENNE